MEVPTDHPHVVRNSERLGGEPIIIGTRASVRGIVESYFLLKMPPEEILMAMPHLTLAQVFDALSYFCDHREEIMFHIKRNHIPDELIDPLVRNMSDEPQSE